MNVFVYPSYINGRITVPPSKSHLHRLLIAAALSDERTVIGNVSELNDDVETTLKAINALGLKSAWYDGGEIVLDAAFPGKEDTAAPTVLDMGESGSSLRFLLPIICALGTSAEFTGKGRLPERPIGGLLSVLSKHGAEFSNDKLPVQTNGKLRNGKYVIRGDVSSQYISGLLFALPLLNGDSEIEIAGETVSESYIKLTLETLKLFGISVEKNVNVYSVKGGQKYVSPGVVRAEGDWSSAAFFAVGAAISGEVTIDGLNTKSCQSDMITVKLLSEAGADVEILKDTVKIRKGDLTPLSFSAEDCPDAVPVMAVALANADGVSVIRGVDRLKEKESDRLSAVMRTLASFGIVCEYKNDALYVAGKRALRGYGVGDGTAEKRTVDGCRDHRIVMSASVFGLVSGGISIISDAECVAKSYKNFFADYRALGGIAEENKDK